MNISQPSSRRRAIEQEKRSSGVHLAIDDRISVTDVDRLQNWQLPPVWAPRENGGVVGQQLSGKLCVMGLEVTFRASILQVHGDTPAQARRGVADVGTRAARAVTGGTFNLVHYIGHLHD